MISKYHRFMQFTRTASVLDMRGDEETRKVRAARFERKNKTGRKGRAVFKLSRLTALEVAFCYGHPTGGATFPYGRDIFWETRLS